MGLRQWLCFHKWTILREVPMKEGTDIIGTLFVQHCDRCGEIDSTGIEGLMPKQTNPLADILKNGKWKEVTDKDDGWLTFEQVVDRSKKKKFIDLSKVQEEEYDGEDNK